VSSWVKTILFLVGSALLTHLIPSSFFRNLDTMVHEFGHAVVTLILSGKVMSIELYADHSGVTHSLIANAWWARIPVSLAGYITASLFAWLLFSLYAKGKQKLGLQVITALALLSLVLFVRNGFGVMWLLGFIAITVAMLLLASKWKWLGDFYYLLLAFLCLEESVFGAGSLVLYAVQDSRQAGDASNLAQATGIPAIVWALVFTVFALWCAKQAVQAFLGKKGRKSEAASSSSMYS